MNRLKAAAVHLTISLTLAALVFALLYFAWFPSPYFVALPLQAGDRDYAVIVGAAPHRPLAVLPIDLWAARP